VNSLIVYVAYNIDKVMLGRLLGAEVLGIYGRAYQLINIPTENLNSAVGGVAISALSRVQNDPGRFRAYFLNGYSLVLAVTIPITIACAMFANDLVGLLLGPKWTGAIPIFRALAPTILAFALINPLSWLLFATGQIRRSMKMALVIAPVVIGGYLAGLSHGAEGVAIGYSVAMSLLVVPLIAWARHGTVPGWAIWVAVRGPLVSAVVSALPSAAAYFVLCSGWSPIGRLLASGTVLVSSYTGMLLFGMGQKRFFLDLLQSLRSRSDAATVAN
jgi:PST family polysaccharide transporter